MGRQNGDAAYIVQRTGLVTEPRIKRVMPSYLYSARYTLGIQVVYFSFQLQPHPDSRSGDMQTPSLHGPELELPPFCAVKKHEVHAGCNRDQ